MERVRLDERGFSFVEILAVFSMISILSGVALYQMHVLDSPIDDASAHIVGLVKKSRSKALATTFAYTVKRSTATRITATYGSTCSSVTQTDDPNLTYNLPETTFLTGGAWEICFTTRGIADDAIDITVSDGDTTRTIEIAMGGGVRLS